VPEVFTGLVLGSLLTLLAFASYGWWLRRQAPSTETDYLQNAEQDLDKAYRDARWQMNDAAGQSWRNLTDWP